MANPPMSEPSTLYFLPLLTAFIVGAIALLINKHRSSELHAKLKSALAQVNEAESKVHLKELEYLAERNKMYLEYI